jgi:hypothetical protein
MLSLLLSCRQFQDSLLQQAANTESIADFKRRLNTVCMSAGRAVCQQADAGIDSSYSSTKELLLANKHVWPQLVARLLLSLQQHRDEGNNSGSLHDAAQLTCVGVIKELLSDDEVCLQLCNQAAAQLPALLAAIQGRKYSSVKAVLHITAAADCSASLRQAMRQYAAQVLAAVQHVAQVQDRSQLYEAAKRTILWLLCNPASDQPAAAAAAVGNIDGDDAAAFIVKLAHEAQVPAAHLQWPPVNIQLLQQPEFLDSMLQLVSGPTSFALLFLERSVAAQGGAAVLATSQRMQRIAAAAEAFLQAVQHAAQPPSPPRQAEGYYARLAAAHAHLIEQKGKDGLRSAVQLLEFASAMFTSKKGLIGLAAHTDMLQKAAAVLQLVPAAWMSAFRMPSEQQVAACMEWAEATAAAAAVALQETKQ